MKICRIVVMLAMASMIFAQYSEKWQVYQDVDERGVLYYDLNQDGVPELTKLWWNWVTFYDGTNDYSIAWQLDDVEFDYLIIWELYDLDSDSAREAVFISSNTIDTVTTRISVYNVYEADPIWTSSEYSGSIYFMDAKDMDGDSQEELVFGINEYDYQDSTYLSRIHILDGSTGISEWTSDVFYGYMKGPYVGDVDGDLSQEIMFNLYDFKNGIYTLHVFQYAGEVSINSSNNNLHNRYKLSPNYPNPFNPSTIIPVSLSEKTHVEVTIFNSNGQVIENILDKTLEPGNYQFRWSGKDSGGAPLPSGIYYYQVATSSGISTRPMVLLK